MPASSDDFPKPPCLPFDPFAYARRVATRLEVTGVDGRPVAVGADEVIKVAISRRHFGMIAHKVDRLGDFKPDFVLDECPLVAVDPREPLPAGLPADALLTVKDGLDVPAITAFRLLSARLADAGCSAPILLKDTLHPPAPNVGAPEDAEAPEPSASGTTFLDTLISSSTVIGALLCDGLGDAVLVQGEPAPGQSLRLAFHILQAAGARIFKTDYVACPSCGRTLFNLQETTGRIKAATVHLKGVKIAIMGCIVNGPGEMADADFGYVGGAPGKINLYVGKQAVKFNIPETEAVTRLVDLIKEHGRWVEPSSASASAPPAPALAD